jgi:uncharacterized cupredoxin-like copper-binding protein
MTIIRTLAFAGAALMALASAASADTIDIKLWDKGPSAEMSTDRGVGGTGDMKMATMGLKLSATKVKAGKVTFKVTNVSKETVHEMLVLPYKDGKQLPYSDKDAKLDEEAAGHLGEVSELEPGKSGSLTLNLKPGRYLLSCNIANHYMNGMWAMLTVK